MVVRVHWGSVGQAARNLLRAPIINIVQFMFNKIVRVMWNKLSNKASSGKLKA